MESIYLNDFSYLSNDFSIQLGAAWQRAVATNCRRIIIPPGPDRECFSSVPIVNPVGLQLEFLGGVAVKMSTPTAQAVVLTDSQYCTINDIRTYAADGVQSQQSWIRCTNFRQLRVNRPISSGHFVHLDLPNGTTCWVNDPQWLDALDANAGSGQSCHAAFGREGRTENVNVRNPECKQPGGGQPFAGLWFGFCDVYSVRGGSLLQANQSVWIAPTSQQTASIGVISLDCIDSSRNGVVLTPSGGGVVTDTLIACGTISVQDECGVNIAGEGGSVNGTRISSCTIVGDRPNSRGVYTHGQGVDTVVLNGNIVGNCSQFACLIDSGTQNVNSQGNNYGVARPGGTSGVGLQIAAGCTGTSDNDLLEGVVPLNQLSANFIVRNQRTI